MPTAIELGLKLEMDDCVLDTLAMTLTGQVVEFVELHQRV